MDKGEKRERPLFSVIVVCLNAGEKLLQTLQTVRSQNFEDYEVVVKDGGSGDGCVGELRKWLEEQPEAFARRVRIIEKADSGIYDAMNQAAAAAAGTWFIFLNCGDFFYDADALGKTSAEIKISAGIKIPEEILTEEVKSETGIYYGDIYDRARASLVASSPRITGFVCYRNLPCHQACVYHRSLFAERGYDTAYRVRADYEHFLWCYYEKKVIPCYVPVTLASYEGAGFSETESSRKQSAREHREITARYMKRRERFGYRLILALTLAPVRTRIANSPAMAGVYNRMKAKLYKRTGG